MHPYSFLVSDCIFGAHQASMASILICICACSKTCQWRRKEIESVGEGIPRNLDKQNKKNIPQNQIPKIMKILIRGGYIIILYIILIDIDVYIPLTQ